MGKCALGQIHEMLGYPKYGHIISRWIICPCEAPRLANNRSPLEIWTSRHFWNLAFQYEPLFGPDSCVYSGSRVLALSARSVDSAVRSFVVHYITVFNHLQLDRKKTGQKKAHPNSASTRVTPAKTRNPMFTGEICKPRQSQQPQCGGVSLPCQDQPDHSSHRNAAPAGNYRTLQGEYWFIQMTGQIMVLKQLLKVTKSPLTWSHFKEFDGARIWNI